MSFTKKSHTKSRAGCDVCRKRRVKCDESVPTCRACLQRGDKCEYSLRFRSTPLQRARSTSPILCAPSLPTARDVPANAHTDQPPACRDTTTLMELELMHQWCTETYRGSAAEHAHLFQTSVVHAAFRHSCLMDSLLALSAIHIASTANHSGDAHKYLATALRYQNRSIARLGELLGNISPDNCDAVLMSSTFNMICALLAPFIPTDSNYAVEPTVDMMVRVRGHMMGMHVIAEQHRDWLLASSLSFVLASPLASRSESYSDSFRLLKDSVARNAVQDSPIDSLICGAIDGLENFLTSSGSRSVLGWLLYVDMEFISALERMETFALVIFMYWGALLHRVDRAWWTQYAGRRIVKEMSLMIEIMDGNWNELREWCHDQVRELPET